LSKTQHTIVTHAFQSNVSTQKRDRASLAISILSQLLPPCYPVSSFQKEIFAQLLPSYNQYKSRFEDCPFEQLWPHCVTLLQSQEDFILIIDALDECRFDHRGQAKEILESLTQVLDCTGGKAVIFSRPNDMFGVGTSSKIHINEIRITEQDTLPEITAFCNSASAKLDLPEEMKLRVASRAKRHADSFLWPAQFLQEFTKTRKMSTLQKILEEYPSDIWSVYTRIWKDRLSKLDEEDKSICRDIFLMLLGARREFDVTELEDALHLIPDSGTAQFIISQHCQPLVEVLDGGVRLSHASVRDFLLNEGISGGGLSMSEPDATLARKCLEFLLKDIYASKDRIGQRLRKNIEVGGSANNQEKSFYEYAARYWYIHLTALLPPTQSLLELAGRFLRSLQFAYWAEYSITDMGDFEAIRSTEITLTVWLQRLPHNDRPLLHLDDYFETPYKNLSREFEENQGDKVLQWMALIQLGFYYFDKGRMTEMADVRKNVATGLTQLLGRRNPLTLRALSDAAYTFLFNNELHKARRLYAGVAADQREVVGESDPSPYFTLVYQSQAEHLMLDSSAALSTLTDSLAGFIRTTGPQSNGSLIAQLWYAVANASAGQIEQAIKMMEFVRDKRREQYGPEDSFGIATQIFMGDLYRKLGDEEKALENIEPALRFRRGFWPISHFMTLDTALILAITYRDFGNDDEAAEIIQELEEHARLDCDQNFVRACQVKHLRALLLFEDGNLNQPIRLLETLLIETNEAHNNRALQWVRLDLAYMLRYRGGEGDEGLASSLFHGIVTDQTHDPDDEPDPPRWLEAAEGALKLLRLGNTQGAKDLLEKEKLHWAREETLWMWLGVPAADTGWMRLPKGLGDDNM
jgi:tetratricopeptide (TPR) repeat protein